VRLRSVLAAGLVAVARLAGADSIVLTTGRVIEADHAWLEGSEVRYVRNDTIYAVARELVARVEAADGGPGLLDPDVRQSRERLAAGQTEDALRHARLALFRQPQSVAALQALAAAQIALGDQARARQTIDQALALEPGSPLSRELLGDALVEAGDFAAAREQYQLAAEAAPQPRVHKKLEALGPVTGSVSSARFRVRFDGAADEPLGLAVLGVLDQAWEDHERRLGFAPDLPIAVVLQTKAAFHDTTRAPGWAAAVNDGTIRVPVAGLDRPTAGLVRVLRHEMAHSFVAARTGTNCPTWLQEGLAQLLEGGDPGREDVGLASRARGGALRRLDALEQPFVGLSQAEAQLAYAESLSAVAYIAAYHGEDGLRRLIAALATGLKATDALNAALGVTYAGLQQGWEQRLAGGAAGASTGNGAQSARGPSQRPAESQR
jgi:tetratricopeptide (TPR) repeat protein